MAKPIRIFIGTDERMGASDIALAHSIEKHCSVPYELHWMRAGTPPFDDWNIGRARFKPYSGKGWATDFTCFRFTIPELANFQGRAIYVDTDMIFLADPLLLFRAKTRKPWESVGTRTDVSVIDCAAFKRFDKWPSIADMKPSGKGMRDYTMLLQSLGAHGVSLDANWDCMDGRGYHPSHTKLIHYTNMRTQPWCPYPEVFNNYPTPHPHPEVCRIWFEYHKEALAKGVTV